MPWTDGDFDGYSLSDMSDLANRLEARIAELEAWVESAHDRETVYQARIAELEAHIERLMAATSGWEGIAEFESWRDS